MSAPNETASAGLDVTGRILFGDGSGGHVIRNDAGEFNVFLRQYGIGSVSTLGDAERLAVHVEVMSLRRQAWRLPFNAHDFVAFVKDGSYVFVALA